MAHAQFVPDIGVVDGEIGNHQIGDQQLLEHVGANIAGACLLVGTKRIEARHLQCRRDVLLEDPVEIDRLAIRAGFGAERHHHEGMGTDGHGSLRLIAAGHGAPGGHRVALARDGRIFR